jgi:hypothetical protein
MAQRLGQPDVVRQTAEHETNRFTLRSDVVRSTPFYGNSAAHLTARIKRGHPDIATRMPADGVRGPTGVVRRRNGRTVPGTLQRASSRTSRIGRSVGRGACSPAPRRFCARRANAACRALIRVTGPACECTRRAELATNAQEAAQGGQPSGWPQSVGGLGMTRRLITRTDYRNDKVQKSKI